MGWLEGHVHDCVDAGPANPSGKRAAQKVKYGEKKRMGFAGWKKRKREKKDEESTMDFIPVGNRKQKVSMPSKQPPVKDSNLNMESISQLMPGADPKLVEAAVQHMLAKADKVELGKRASEEHDNMPLKKTYAEASTSQLVVATDNPYRSLSMSELTQETQPLALSELTQAQPQTPQIDLTKSGDEMSDHGAAASLL
jgi:hypothetical protein